MIISTVSAVIWNVLCAAMIRNTDVTKNLEIGPEFYQDFLNAYVNNGLSEWWIMSAIGVLLFMALCATVNYLKHNTKR